MRILNITAQKPSSTGSGIYLTELVKTFAEQGHSQAVIAGVYEEDEVLFPEGTRFFPVFFGTPDLPFPIAGMSDEMPYESTVYSTMTPEMVTAFKQAFAGRVMEAVESFCPDVVVCHHLYLLTALVRELLPESVVYGFCHNTDLRQMKKNPLARDYIRTNIKKLDVIFGIHEEQKKEIMDVYGTDASRIRLIGSGYNDKIFYKKEQAEKEEGHPIRLIYAGKLAEKKGVMSLLRSLSYLPYKKDELILSLAGGAGNQVEYEEIRRLAKECPYRVEFLGKLPQAELAEGYNKSDIFVLPSFFEGMPLTVIEALACGDKVVISDLPGVGSWIGQMIPGAKVWYVPLPEMVNTDEPVKETLPEFEQNIASAIREAAESEPAKTADMSRISWSGIGRKVLENLI